MVSGRTGHGYTISGKVTNDLTDLATAAVSRSVRHLVRGRRNAAQRRSGPKWKDMNMTQPAFQPTRVFSPADIENIVISALSQTLYMAPQSVQREQTFTDAGLDSILAVDYMDQLNRRLGITEPVALLYKHETPATLAAYLVERLNRDGTDSEE
jgi:acyl carrier protein